MKFTNIILATIFLNSAAFAVDVNCKMTLNEDEKGKDLPAVSLNENAPSDLKPLVKLANGRQVALLTETKVEKNGDKKIKLSIKISDRNANGEAISRISTGSIKKSIAYQELDANGKNLLKIKCKSNDED